MGYWPIAQKALYESDIVLLIIDARMPEMSRNFELESQIQRKGKSFLLVFNKIDLVSKETLKTLKERYAEGFFVSGNRNLGMKKLKEGIYIEAKRRGIEEPKVGVVGYPNVGKSSIINALAKRARTQVSSVAGTTKGVQWVRVGNMKVLDSPGVIPFNDKSIKLAVVGAKDPEKLRVPEKAAVELLEFIFQKKEKKSLEEFYGIELSDEPYEILEQIGKKRGFLLKGGKIDERRTAVQLLRDWQRGRLKIN